jgi:hypothetical protein
MFQRHIASAEVPTLTVGKIFLNYSLQKLDIQPVYRPRPIEERPLPPFPSMAFGRAWWRLRSRLHDSVRSRG